MRLNITNELFIKELDVTTLMAKQLLEFTRDKKLSRQESIISKVEAGYVLDIPIDSSPSKHFHISQNTLFFDKTWIGSMERDRPNVYLRKDALAIIKNYTPIFSFYSVKDPVLHTKEIQSETAPTFSIGKYDPLPKNKSTKRRGKSVLAAQNMFAEQNTVGNKKNQGDDFNDINLTVNSL
ncbi:MAG: hypothetical protein P1U74_09145 [Legionellaceae bacterium]|nr:hypothetical protein [Legionellaceae bacterium]